MKTNYDKYLTRLNMTDFFDAKKIAEFRIQNSGARKDCFLFTGRGLR